MRRTVRRRIVAVAVGAAALALGAGAAAPVASAASGSCAQGHHGCDISTQQHNQVRP